MDLSKQSSVGCFPEYFFPLLRYGDMLISVANAIYNQILFSHLSSVPYRVNNYNKKICLEF